MAAMSVIGIDFGNESCYVAVAKAGGIETIANDYSLRGTPSCVAFSQKNRILGVAAKNQMVTNMKNTVTGFKRLLGRKFNDPHVQRELPHLPFKVEERGDGGVGVRVRYLNEEQVFTPEQLTAMLFTKLKESSAIALQTQVNDCVISVPSYFTNTERKALLDSAAIAGLNVLRLMNETTATALAYGIYKQDLPAAEEKPRNVVFVDVGQASLQVAACAFHRGKLRVLATASDAEFGGRDIDLLLANHFCKDFQTRYKIDARSNPRAFLRLLQEVERIKKQMSANSTKLPLNIECFMEEKDVTGEMQRSTMETLCADLFKKVEECLQYCLHMSKLRLDDIHSVEVVGGSSRIPAIKSIIESVFGKPASTTLNQDEAVARGAALQCAMLSPAVRVREFSVTDVQPYSVRLAWDADAGEDGEMEVFQANHAAPFSKLLTFYRREPFSINAYYGEQVPFPDSNIGQWRVNEITPTSEGESQKIKIKVRVNLHGIVTVASASLVEKKEAGDNGKDAQVASETQDADGETPMEHNGADQTNGEGNGNDVHNEEMTDMDKKDKSKGKKQMVKLVELPIKAEPCGFTQQELNNLTEQECSMQAADRQEKERADARNALEEYVYDVRGKVCEGGNLQSFVPVAQATSLSKLLHDTENWLYEEGEDCNRQVYMDKLNELRGLGEPIKQRFREWEMCPAALQEFSISIQLARKAVHQCKSGDAKFSHLTEQDVQKLTDTVETGHRWVEQTRQTLLSASKDQNLPTSAQQIAQEKQNFDSTINPIVNKPKPKEKTPPPAADSQGQTQGENQAQPPQPNQQSDQPVDQMDVE